jgi:hypothetical protein
MSLAAGVIQHAITGTGALPPKRSASSGARAQVEVAVLASPGVPAPVEPEKGRFHLVPGSTFSVRVVLRPAGTAEADAVDFAETALLSLAWKGPEGLTAQPEEVSIGPADIGNHQATREFWLKTDAGVKGVQGRLVLSRRGSRGTPEELRSLELHIEEAGAGMHLPDVLREKSLVDLELAPANPEATAFLHVEATDKKLRLHCFPSKDPRTALLEILEPSRNLLDPPGERNTEKILDAVQDFFRRHCARLASWLQERVKARSDVTLIIQEHAETRVPWEMLELHTQQGLTLEPTPVGALIRVVRWLTAMDASEGAIRLKTERQTWSGQALSYVAAEELGQAQQELDELSGCRHERFEDIELLRKKLRKLTQPPAILFVASHGQLTQEPEPGAPEPPLTRLTRNLPTLVQAARPLAFFNACHSGLLMRDDFGISGLPEKLLGKFAGAYLGVMGKIEEGVAARVGARILKAARADSGVCIPELLREIRKEAYEELDLEDNESRADYVSKFMYVFYGTPEAYLKLEPAGGVNG